MVLIDLVNSLGIVCHSNDVVVPGHLMRSPDKLGEHLNGPTATLEGGLHNPYGCWVTLSGRWQSLFLRQSGAACQQPPDGSALWLFSQTA